MRKMVLAYYGIVRHSLDAMKHFFDFLTVKHTDEQIAAMPMAERLAIVNRECGHVAILFSLSGLASVAAVIILLLLSK